MKEIAGFSKMTKEKKIDWLVRHFFKDELKAKETLAKYWNEDAELQRLHDEFSENTLSNYYLPFGVAPNFLINGKWHVIPMVTEESSVVAAAGKAAKFWSTRGGFNAEVLGTTKSGQIHFKFSGDYARLEDFFNAVEPALLASTEELTKNMRKRGGGITDLRLVDKTSDMENYYQLSCNFETADAMGANFINSCLERIADKMKELAAKYEGIHKHLEVVMAILSNYVPECVVRATVSCPLNRLLPDKEQGVRFAEKFMTAVEIAQVAKERAVTHNKGIMNGVDAVVLATGNDFRAVEAGVHAYAARSGSYRSLSQATIEGDTFKFWLDIPLALGTVGGLTSLHPLVKLALEMLQNPSSEELMKIVAAVGLAQNFAAVGSLVTTGIQEGHMKMHLQNILNQYGATKAEKEKLLKHFSTGTVSHSAVWKELDQLRKNK